MSRVLFLAIFTIVMLRWAAGWRRVVAVTLVATVSFSVIFPPPVFAQFGLMGGIQNVITIITGAIQTALNAVRTVTSALDALYQSVVWPIDLITRAKNSIVSLTAQFRGLLRSIHDVRTASATLPDPISLEALLQNRKTDDFPALVRSYSRVFGLLPPDTDADAPTRNIIDIDDAVALETLKTAKAGDQIAEQVLESGNQVEDDGKFAAPGSGTIFDGRINGCEHPEPSDDAEAAPPEIVILKFPARPKVLALNLRKWPAPIPTAWRLFRLSFGIAAPINVTRR